MRYSRYSIHFHHSVLAIITVCFFCFLGCDNGGTSDNPGSEQGGEGSSDIVVKDGKVKFYLAQADGAPRKIMGVNDPSWKSMTVEINGTKCDVNVESGGKFYVEAPASSSGSYSASLTSAHSSQWYGSSPYSQVSLPCSQFYDVSVERLKDYPQYACYSKETGNTLYFNDGFALLDLVIRGSAKIASVKISADDGRILAGTANFLPSAKGFKMKDGVSFAVLNCTCDGDYVLLDESGSSHFYLMLSPGEYDAGTLSISVSDASHLSMTEPLSSLKLEAGKAVTQEIKYSPDEDLVFSESFDNFVWGGNIMGGAFAIGYSPDDAAIKYDGGLNRNGYSSALMKVSYNNPGTGFIQSNSWNDVSGKTVASSHQVSDAYVRSRNISDYVYMFRCQEYQGILACGTGNGGRGMFETCNFAKIDGFSEIIVDFDFCYQYGSTDQIRLDVKNGGMIKSLSINGKSVNLTEINSGYSEITGWGLLEKSYVTLPSSDDAVKEWQHAEVTIHNATNGTRLCWGGNYAESGVHGFYLDNIFVHSKPIPRSGIRFLCWNIQYGMWGDQANNYDNFVKWVKKYDPDICVWCESASALKDNSSLASSSSDRFLPNGWQQLAARYGHSYVKVGGWRDNFPQTITSKYPIETLLKVTDTDDVNKPVVHGAALHQVDVGGTKINVVTLHLWPQQYAFGVPASGRDASIAEHGGDYYRLYEMTYLCEKILSNADYSGTPYWLMAGDFNSRSPFDNWYYNYPDDDTRLLVHKYINDNTNMKDVIASKYLGKFLSSTYGSARIDFVYASPEAYSIISEADILKDSWTDSTPSPYVPSMWVPSDHRPILLDINIK